MKKYIFILLSFIITNSNAQNQVDLLVLQHDGKINLVPRYGFDKIEKTNEQKLLDDKFINDAIKQFGSKDSASIVYNQLGWKYFYNGDLKTAMKRFNQAWILDESNASEYFGFSAILNVIKDNPEKYFVTKIKKINEVEDPTFYYKIALQKDLNNKYLRFALIFMATGYEIYNKVDFAIESCNKLIEFEPNNEKLFHQRGHLFSVSKQWKKSIDDQTKAILLGNNNSNALNDLGYSYEQFGDFEKAKEYYNKSSQVNPDFLNPIYNNTLLHLKIGEYEKALGYIDN